MDEVIDFYAPALSKEKNHLMVRDCGSNMITAAAVSGTDSSDCFAHKVQNAVKDGINQLGSMNGADGTIEKVKSVVRKLRKSNVESVKFKGLQEEEGLPQVELKK
ncbi:hypothetical protein AAVH_25932, partial [Aphelenchoides avenae]